MEDELSLVEEKKEEVQQEQQELLHDQVEQLKCSNAALFAEIDMCERFIGRIDPRDLVSKAGGDGPGAGASNLEGGVRRRRSRANISEPLQQLTLEQKLYVAQREVTETRQDQEKVRRTYERIQDNSKASLKESELHLAEIRMAQKKFDSKLLKTMKDNRLEMAEPEKVLQFIQDKSKVTQLETFMLKNQTLKAHEKKLQQQLQQKKEMGKAEYEDIFQGYSEQRIDKTLAELQENNSKVLCVLGKHKEKLHRVTLEAAELSDDLAKKKQLLEKIEAKMQHAEEERLKAEALNQRLRRQMADYQAPDVADYMLAKDKHKKLQRSIHAWERKFGVAELAGRSLSRAASTQRPRGPGRLPHIAQTSS
ncbi:coiled-coil domain-containing protein 113 isoform X2 [Pseudoliparis swirei]|uniref:coiled-coil domain-containing protein 113 isoform X2 n=1 Tax=Pseudoliparis swirei TaxID=2059687 RepID=UPI0024BEFD24|nr:coiled-coil domain-containing protein 113 isoform X2 [Pseudoliparis swirei]